MSGTDDVGGGVEVGVVEVVEVLLEVVDDILLVSVGDSAKLEEKRTR